MGFRQSLRRFFFRHPAAIAEQVAAECAQDAGYDRPDGAGKRLSDLSMSELQERLHNHADSLSWAQGPHPDQLSAVPTLNGDLPGWFSDDPPTGFAYCDSRVTGFDLCADGSIELTWEITKDTRDIRWRNTRRYQHAATLRTRDGEFVREIYRFVRKDCV